jgi:hypothetical protein
MFLENVGSQTPHGVVSQKTALFLINVFFLSHEERNVQIPKSFFNSSEFGTMVYPLTQQSLVVHAVLTRLLRFYDYDTHSLVSHCL